MAKGKVGSSPRPQAHRVECVLGGALAITTPLVLELQDLGSQHDHSEVAQAVLAEAEQERAKLQGRLERQQKALHQGAGCGRAPVPPSSQQSGPDTT